MIFKRKTKIIATFVISFKMEIINAVRAKHLIKLLLLA